MVGWLHQLNGYEFEQAPGVGDGQGSLACYSPWSHKELDMTEQANSNISLCPGKLNDFMQPFSEGPLRIHDLIQRIVNQTDTEGLKRQKGVPKHGIGSCQEAALTVRAERTKRRGQDYYNLEAE